MNHTQFTDEITLAARAEKLGGSGTTDGINSQLARAAFSR